MYVLVVGNPIDGVDIIGTFDSTEDAVAWAEVELKNDEWWISEVTVPGKVV